MRKTGMTIAASMASVLIAMTVSLAVSAQVKILFNSFEPPGGAIFPGAIKPWIAEVERVTEGRVKIEVPPTSLAPPPQQYELVKQGVADGAYTLNVWLQKQWLLPQIGHLAFAGGTSKATAVALWRTHKRFFETANEYNDVELLGYCAGPASFLFTLGDKPITSAEDIKGKKMFAPANMAKPFQALGAAVVVGPVVRIHDQVSKGIVDMAAGLSYHPADGFNAMPYLKSATEIPGGLFAPTFSIILSKAKWAQISKDDQAKIMEVSGEKLARSCEYWDTLEKASMDKFLKSGKTRVAAPPELIAALKKAFAPDEEAWLADAKKRGVDGVAALAYYRQQIEAVMAEK